MNIQNLISLKILKMSNPKSSDFDNKLKSIMGKSLTET